MAIVPSMHPDVKTRRVILRNKDVDGLLEFVFKLRDFVFYLMSDDNFNWRPAEMMEEYLRNEGRGISRQTIGKYLQHFEALCLFVRTDDFVYYKVKKNYGVQEHEIITKEEYCDVRSLPVKRRRNSCEREQTTRPLVLSQDDVPYLRPPPPGRKGDEEVALA